MISLTWWCEAILFDEPLHTCSRQHTIKMRYIAIDSGNHFSGIVVADIVEHAQLTIKFIDVFHNAQKAVSAPLNEYLKDRIAPFLEEPGIDAVLLLETVYARNFRLVTINRVIRKYFKGRGIRCQNMSPRQKPGVTSSRDVERKAQALVSARAVLAEHAAGWLDHFENGLGSRVHDVADALLMVEYVRSRR